MKKYKITLIDKGANEIVEVIEAETAEDALTFLRVNRLEKQHGVDGKPFEAVSKIEAIEFQCSQCGYIKAEASMMPFQSYRRY